MRRKDREITDREKIRQIVSSCTCMHLGLNDNGEVYIVPLSFGFSERDGAYTFYFHGAKEGRKIDLIRQNPYVGFEMDTHVEIVTADTACGHSARYQSVIGNGYVRIVEDEEDKKAGLRAVMKQNTGKDAWEFPKAALQGVCVCKLTVTQLSCKEHI